MASCKVIRRLAVLHQTRGLCHSKQEALQPDHLHLQPRSALQLLADMEKYVTSPDGKEVLAELKDHLQREKERFKHMVQRDMEMCKHLQREVAALEKRMAPAQIALLESKGLNDTLGLFQKFQEELQELLKPNNAAVTTTTTQKGASFWEAILKTIRPLRLCIQDRTKIPAKDVVNQAAHCCTIYSVLSQHHAHGGNALAKLQAAKGQILFQRGPMSPEQMQAFLCIGQAAGFDIAEDPSTGTHPTQGQILFQRGPMSPEQVQTFLCIGQAAGFANAEDPNTRPG